MSDFDCYKVLELDKDSATPNDIKKAYRKLALKYHPDKQPANASDEEKQKANETFQNMGKAYTVLSDPQRKTRYDRTGSMEESEFEEEKDWSAFFKELWNGVVNSETIEAQIKKYQGSEEERKDVLDAYKRYEGDMSNILEAIEGSTAKDGIRFEKMIREAIKLQEAKPFKRFEKTTRKSDHESRIKREEKEILQFNSIQKENSLEKSIQKNAVARKGKFDSIIQSIEAKDRKKNKRKHELAEPNLPSEEEFAKLQEKLFKKSKK